MRAVFETKYVLDLPHTRLRRRGKYVSLSRNVASLVEREGKFFEQSSNTLTVTVQRETDASESSALPTELSEGSINVFDENETLYILGYTFCAEFSF